MTLAGNRLALEVDDTGAVYPLTIGPVLENTEDARLTAASERAFAFGAHIASDGDVIAVAAYADSPPRSGPSGPSSNSIGAVYIFDKPAGGWVDATETAKLVSSAGACVPVPSICNFDNLGLHGLGMSGDTVVAVSVFAEAGAYVWVKPAGGWSGTITEVATLSASDQPLNNPQNGFGSAVAISGNTIAVGAFRDDDKDTDAGAVYVFVEPAGGWSGPQTEAAKRTASDGVANDQMGFNNGLALLDDTLVVGTRLGESAYVFTGAGSSWTEQAKLTASDGLSGDLFGQAVALSDEIAVVGAYEAGVKGAAYVFVEPASGWATTTETAKLTPGDSLPSDSFALDFGISAAISGDTVVVGVRHTRVNFIGLQARPMSSSGPPPVGSALSQRTCWSRPATQPRPSSSAPTWPSPMASWRPVPSAPRGRPISTRASAAGCDDADDDGICDDDDPDDDNDGQSDEDELACGSDPLDDLSLADDNDADDSPDCVDADDDNDGTDDVDDAFPFDDTESSDNDDDGIGDNADPDDDNDGQSDGDELARGSDPLDDFSLAADHDGDDSPDCVDADDDNDNVEDSEDNCPLTANEDQADFDGDGIGDACDPDDDNDGVFDEGDACSATLIPEGVPTNGLNPNRWALTDGDTIFDTISRGKGKGPGRSYTTADTGGCSCEQIIAAQGLGNGHTKFGCSISAMDDWVALVSQ